MNTVFYMNADTGINGSFDNNLISLKYMMTKDWDKFVGKIFKVKAIYDGRQHIILVKIIEKDHHNFIVADTVSLERKRRLYLDKSNVDHLYIIENYPELCL